MNEAFTDAYEHIDPYIIYSPENIEESCEIESCGCSCESDCSPEECSCLQRSGALYTFKTSKACLDTYRLLKESDDKPINECHANCSCEGSLCGNRLVQFGPREGLKIIECNENSQIEESTSEHDRKGCADLTSSCTEKYSTRDKNTGGKVKYGKGYGLISDSYIEKGSFICEYAGEVISEEEAKKRYQSYKSSLRNFIFCIRENFGNNQIMTFIDPTFIGNIGRYMNHSCDPNCELVLVRTGGMTPKLCIFAKHNIPSCEELTFNYGAENVCNDIEKYEGRIPCLCKKDNCRKFLPFDPTIS